MENEKVSQTPISELNVKKRKEKTNFKFKLSIPNLERSSWFTFYFNRGYFKICYSPFSYFNPRPQIVSNVTSILAILILLYSIATLNFTWYHLMLIPFFIYGFGDFYLSLPFDTGKYDADYPSYGVQTYHPDPFPGKINFPTSLYVQWGDYNFIEFPWSYTWVRTSVMLKDGTWDHETKGNKKDFYEYKKEGKQFFIDYDFTDKYDNQVIPTKVYLEEREWRQRWLKWTGLLSNVRRVIVIEFSKEVGSRKGSWKGGTVGCSYPIMKNESVLECIQRMEKERTFR